MDLVRIPAPTFNDESTSSKNISVSRIEELSGRFLICASAEQFGS